MAIYVLKPEFGSIVRITDYINSNIKYNYSYNCIVKDSLIVYKNRAAGTAGGAELCRLKDNTKFRISNIQRAFHYEGNSTYTDNQWSGEVTIAPDYKNEILNTFTKGYVNIVSGGQLAFYIENCAIGNINSKVLTKIPLPSELYTTTTNVNPVQLITPSNTLNTATISDLGTLSYTNELTQNVQQKIAAMSTASSIVTDIDITASEYDYNWTYSSSISAVNDYKSVINDIDIGKLRGIIGLPYQFLPTTDNRIDGTENEKSFGLEYADMIMSRLNLLYIIPGNPTFLPAGNANNKRKGFIEDAVAHLAGDSADRLDNLLNDYSGKLYSIEPAYPEYYKYVNPMCRIGVFMLGLNRKSGDENDPTTLAYKSLDGIALERFNWAINDGSGYTGSYDGTDEDENGTNNTPFDTTFTEDLKAFQKWSYYRSAIPFYINSETSFSETFNNETTESFLATSVNGLSDKAREVQFLLGTATNIISKQFDQVADALAKSGEDTAAFTNSALLGKNTIFGSLVDNLKTVVSGGRLMFPNIWSNSGMSRAYSVNTKLTCPDTDAKSWWLRMYVPLCHYIALVLPRGQFQNGYTAPFIIKAIYKGQYNIDLGLITDMTITRGKEGGWTKDGLPMVIDISFTIQDLYPNMSMSPSGPLMSSNVLKNISEMDYLANLCGVNINEPDIVRMIDMYITLNIENYFTDIPANIVSGFTSVFTNKINKIFSFY